MGSQQHISSGGTFSDRRCDALASGTLLGIAQLTKFTLLLLYLAWPLIWLGDYFSKVPGDRPRLRATVCRHGSIMLAISVLTINAGYGFQDTCLPLGDFGFVSRMFAGEPPPEVGFFYSEGPSGNRFRGTWLERITVPLPADYVYGFDLQRRDFEAGFESYLAGEWRHHGWWYYYLYAMAVKVPLGILILVVSNIV